MFTRSLFQTADIAAQGKLLTQVSKLVDEGTIRTTLAEHFGTINAANLRRAHALIESKRTFKLPLAVRLDGGPPALVVLEALGPTRAILQSLIQACIG